MAAVAMGLWSVEGWEFSGSSLGAESDMSIL